MAGISKWCDNYLDSREAFKNQPEASNQFVILLVCFTRFRKVLWDNVSGFYCSKKNRKTSSSIKDTILVPPRFKINKHVRSKKRRQATGRRFIFSGLLCYKFLSSKHDNKTINTFFFLGFVFFASWINRRILRLTSCTRFHFFALIGCDFVYSFLESFTEVFTVFKHQNISTIL